MKITNAFVAFERHTDGKGKVMLDDDGCCYLKPHGHKLMRNADGSQRVWCNQNELITAISDHNAPKQDQQNPSIMVAVAESEKFKGEVILLNVMTFE